MNEHLSERFGRASRGQQYQRIQAEVVLLPPKLNRGISNYYTSPTATGGEWLTRSEIPGSAEIMDRDSRSSDVVELPANKPIGPYACAQEYLSTHYELLREDSLRPLRESVSLIREAPTASEDTFNGQVEIYEKASHFSMLWTSLTPSANDRLIYAA